MTEKLPVYKFSRSTYKAHADGIYVFTGATCTLTVALGSNAEIRALDQSGIRVIKNVGSGNLTVSGTLYTSSAVGSIVVAAGGAVMLFWDGAQWLVFTSA
jgi:hypothetical protein